MDATREILEIGNSRLVVVLDHRTGSYYRMARAEAEEFRPDGPAQAPRTTSRATAPDPPTDVVNGVVQRLCRSVAGHPRTGRWLLTALVALAASTAALAAVTVDWPAAWAAASSVGTPTAVTAVIATLAVAMVHELAHALALALLGGRVGRVGVTLVHLVPALYCDTTDVWRLRRGDRALVLLAGVLTNAVAGAAALLAYQATPADPWLAAFGLLNVGLAVFNAVPLLKVDGYYVVESTASWPGLREDCVRYAEAVVGRWTGRRQGRVPPPGERPVWCFLFGALSAVTPPVLLVAGVAVALQAVVLS